LILLQLKLPPNKFSDDNKLGEGGFGVVYKVQDPFSLFVFVFVFVRDSTVLGKYFIKHTTR
jgi:serine/threonine protein kinase